MNEILTYLETVRDGGWMVLCAIMAVATAFLVLDRPAKSPAREHLENESERRAA